MNMQTRYIVASAAATFSDPCLTREMAEVQKSRLALKYPNIHAAAPWTIVVVELPVATVVHALPDWVAA